MPLPYRLSQGPGAKAREQALISASTCFFACQATICSCPQGRAKAEPMAPGTASPGKRLHRTEPAAPKAAPEPRATARQEPLLAARAAAATALHGPGARGSGGRAATKGLGLQATGAGDAAEGAGAADAPKGATARRRGAGTRTTLTPNPTPAARAGGEGGGAARAAAAAALQGMGPQGLGAEGAEESAGRGAVRILARGDGAVAAGNDAEVRRTARFCQRI